MQPFSNFKSSYGKQKRTHKHADAKDDTRTSCLLHSVEKHESRHENHKAHEAYHRKNACGHRHRGKTYAAHQSHEQSERHEQIFERKHDCAEARNRRKEGQHERKHVKRHNIRQNYEV